jgi:hypothetical protein
MAPHRPYAPKFSHWYPKTLPNRIKCPSRGAGRNRDIVMTAHATSNRPSVTIHCRAPIKDWYLTRPSSLSSFDVSSSGCVFSGIGTARVAGLLPMIRSYISNERAIYHFVPQKRVPSGSLPMLPPRKTSGASVTPFNPKPRFSSLLKKACGSFIIAVRSST